MGTGYTYIGNNNFNLIPVGVQMHSQQWGLSYNGKVLAIFNDRDEAVIMDRIMRKGMWLADDDPALYIHEWRGL